MSHHGSEPLTAEERRAREALERLPRPRARPSFRERLKRDFVSGTIGAPAGRPQSGHRPGWRLRPGLVLAPAAAAVVVVVVGVWLGRGPEWTLVSAQGDGIAVVDGRPIPIGHREQLERALRRGARIRLEATGVLELAAPGQMAVGILPATEATLPAPARRWLGRELSAEVRSGELRITTGRGFHGARLAVTTPEALVEVTGTTLAVIREPVGTCVCVYEGRVRMGPRGEAMAAIPAGMRRFVFNDGRPPEQDSMRATEREQLGEMRKRHVAGLAAGR